MASVEIPRKEKENHFRMQLLLDRGILVLRDVLNNQLQLKYPGLYVPSSNGDISGVLNDQKVKHSLIRLQRRNILNPSQMKILYPSGSPAPPVTLQSLDITLTVVLLRNITNLNLRARWNNPPASNTSTEANIGRVKRYRNKNAHATEGLSDSEFQTQFTDLKTILLSLSTLYASDDYDKLQIQPLVASETPCQLLPTKLPRRNTKLKGRDDIIATIEQHISEKAPLILLTGMGGIGKTSIAVKVGQNMLTCEQHGAMVVLYVDMRQVTDLNSVKLSLVQHYHPTRDLKDLYSDYQNIFTQTLSRLSSDTLLILDNNDSVLSLNRHEFCEFVRDVVDSTNHITLLCTSRERFDFPTYDIVVLDIPLLDKTASLQVLWERKSTNPTDCESADLAEMAKKCGHNPLAMKLLAAILNTKTTKTVLEEIQNTQKILPTLSIPSMPKEIMSCFDISYETLEPETRKMFLSLHIFPVAFNLEAVSAILGIKQKDCEHILDSLVNKSLVIADNNIYDIHPLLREYAEHKAREYGLSIFDIQDAYCSHYIKVLKRLKSTHYGTTKANILPVILPHVKHTAALLIKQLEIQEVPVAHETLENLQLIGELFKQFYIYEDALYIYNLVSQKKEEMLGIKHPDIASCYNTIGTVLKNMGEFKAALDYFNKCLAVNEEILGPKHPDTATCYNNIGTVLQDLGEYKAALDYLRKSLAVREEIFDPRHPDTASSYNNIGAVLANMGEYKAALDYFNKCLAVNEEILGPKHPYTASSYSNIGTVLQDMGEYKAALDYLRKCLAVREEIFDPRHPDTASSYDNIGTVLKNMGEFKAALDYFNKCLAVREDILGPKHPDTASSYERIGIVLQDMGEYKAALDYLNKCLAVNEVILGPKHPDTASSYNNIGSVLHDMGEYKAAFDYLNKSLAVNEEIFGPKHRDTASSYSNIGRVLQDMGENKAAFDYLNKSLAVNEEILGPKHPVTAASYSNIGSVLHVMGEYKAALDYFNKCLEVREKIFGPKHPYTASSYSNIGSVLQVMGEYKAALDYFNKCLEVREKIFGPKHPYTANSYEDIGTVLQDMGKYKAALDYQNKCLAVREEMLGPKHPDTARSYSNIGSVLQVMALIISINLLL